MGLDTDSSWLYHSYLNYEETLRCRTETTIGAFRAFVRATGTVTAAEREGGGFVYEGGWRRMPGWTWATPFGRPASDDEPAVHVTFDEPEAYCRWAGKRLPTDAEWDFPAVYIGFRCVRDLP